MAELLSLVMGFRDRDLERVERCLDSLARQTFRSFDLTLVDYGSASDTSQELAELASRYPFCRVLYTETRGWPWNRSRALNIGGRRARAPFLMTSDVDMIFPERFLAAVADELREDRVVYCYPYQLPRRFSDWKDPERHARTLTPLGKSAFGGCCVLYTELFGTLRGFDEYYCYWGVEDRDLNARLIHEGVAEIWLNDVSGAPPLFHQWHPASNHKTVGFLPFGFWGRAESHFLSRRGVAMRNELDWGRVETEESRPALAFLDFEEARIRRGSELAILEGNPYDNRFLSQVLRTFWDLPPGHALAVSGASVPRERRSLDELIRVANGLLRRSRLGAEIGYRTNVVHSYLAELVHQPAAGTTPVADYYLDFPAGDGIDLLVRA